MTVESGSTLFTGTWNFIYSLISGNIPDPLTRGKKWIHGEFPDVEKSEFSGYPTITIDNPHNTVEQSSWTTNSLMNNIMEIPVVCWSKTAMMTNELSENIYNIMKDNELVFSQSGLNFDSIVPGANGVDIIGNQRIHWNEQIVRARRVSL